MNDVYPDRHPFDLFRGGPPVKLNKCKKCGVKFHGFICPNCGNIL